MSERSFIMVPSGLLYGFREISVEAKLLYALLLDRVGLSEKNGWQDKDGRTYVICTVTEVQGVLNVGKQKASKIIAELEEKKLIEKHRQGLGKPNIIYVNDIESDENGYIRKDENHTSVSMKTELPEVQESAPIHINNNHNNNIYIENTHISSYERIYDGYDRDNMREIIKKKIEYSILLEWLPYDRGKLDELVELMVETVCTSEPITRVSCENKPTGVVRDRFLSLQAEHIQYVMESMKQNESEVRNMKRYLITALYNAPLTMEHSYQNKDNCPRMKWWV